MLEERGKFDIVNVVVVVVVVFVFVLWNKL
jgi:hypothetical protein